MCCALPRLQKFLLGVISVVIPAWPFLSSQAQNYSKQHLPKKTAHQGNKSKWYLQTQVPLPHAFQQDSPSAMVSALHSLYKQSCSRVHVTEFIQETRCLDLYLVLQGSLTFSHQQGQEDFIRKMTLLYSTVLCGRVSSSCRNNSATSLIMCILDEKG